MELTKTLEIRYIGASLCWNKRSVRAVQLTSGDRSCRVYSFGYLSQTVLHGLGVPLKEMQSWLELQV